jgi:MinD-like ATPase involved in chromosome partitioning or flagellar assembly
MMSCVFVLIFIPNTNSIKNTILTLRIYNFDDNNSLINWFVISKISIIKPNDNKIELSSKMQVIRYTMN